MGYQLLAHQQSHHRDPGKKLAALEHAPAARVFASGMAAITATLSSLRTPADHVLALRSAYHPSSAFLDTEMKKYGVEVTYLERFYAGRDRAQPAAEHQGVLSGIPIVQYFSGAAAARSQPGAPAAR